MNEFEKHLRRGTGSHRSFLLPTEVKKTNNSNRKKIEARRRHDEIERNKRNKRQIEAQIAASQARRECNSLYNEIVRLAESASAYGRELVRANASANEYADKIIPLMEEAGKQIVKLAFDVGSVVSPPRKLIGAIAAIKFIARSSGQVAGNPKRIREALDIFTGINGIIEDVSDLLHNINQISNYVDRINKQTIKVKAYDRALKQVEERGESLIARYKQKGCGEHSDIGRVASKITMYKV